MKRAATKKGRQGAENSRAGDLRELRRLLGPWTATLRARSPHTARSYSACVSRFLDSLGSVGLSDQTVSCYLDSLGDLAAASRAHHVSAVRSFLAMAKKRGVVATAPEDLLVRPRVAVTSFGRYLDEQELRALLRAARRLSPRHHGACLALALTGLRVSELAGAKWRDLFRDPEGRLGVRVLGKGTKERVVKVRDDLFRALAELHGSEDLDARDASPLLPDGRGTPYTTRGIHKLVAQAARAAAIAKPVSPHWLRHTHATLAAVGGAPAVVIQASLGHARLETSQRYIHWARGLEETTVDAMPALG